MKTCCGCGVEKDEDQFYNGMGRCKPCRKEVGRKWLAEHPEHARTQHIKRRYGITQEDFDSMSLYQGGVCEICKKPPCGKRAMLHVDHDHTLGNGRHSVRGLLCYRCNLLLGLCQDDPTTLESAVEYLWSYKDVA